MSTEVRPFLVLFFTICTFLEVLATLLLVALEIFRRIFTAKGLSMGRKPKSDGTDCLLSVAILCQPAVIIQLRFVNSRKGPTCVAPTQANLIVQNKFRVSFKEGQKRQSGHYM